MNGRLAVLGFLLVFMPEPMFSCSCVWKTMPAADYGASVVFRGTVTEKKSLAVRPEMPNRGRYAITFRADEYWKGSRQATVVIYGLDDGTDCLGGSSYEVGTEYLVFASQKPSQDVLWPDGTTFWYGWTDVVSKGSPVLMTSACAPTGKVSELFVRDAVNRLGTGSTPLPEAK
jgi:hypothetical protein